MTEDERIDRMSAVLNGTGAKVNDAFGIWALNSQLADAHISELAGWADLEYLVAESTQITDASIGPICGFRRLVELSIGGNAITHRALADCDLPPMIECLGLHSIPLDDEAVASVCRCQRITALNMNHCQLSFDAIGQMARLPNLRGIEALGAATTPETSKALSSLYPRVLFRLRDGLWQEGECLRPPFPNERT